MDAVLSLPTLDTRRPTTIAVMAMGGQGGGVLVDWIVALIEGRGWLVQSTSVPGVAQRTGATIYYVEAIESDGSGRRPVLSLMPVPGEVDIVIGAELMEAGRAMQRGLVSPDRTTLIASSHRAYAVSEKIAPGDGVTADSSTQPSPSEAPLSMGPAMPLPLITLWVLRPSRLVRSLRAVMLTRSVDENTPLVRRIFQ